MSLENNLSTSQETLSSTEQSTYGYESLNEINVNEARRLVDYFYDRDVEHLKNLFKSFKETLSLNDRANRVKWGGFKPNDTDTTIRNKCHQFLDAVVECGVKSWTWPLQSQKFHPLDALDNAVSVQTAKLSISSQQAQNADLGDVSMETAAETQGNVAAPSPQMGAVTYSVRRTPVSVTYTNAQTPPQSLMMQYAPPTSMWIQPAPYQGQQMMGYVPAYSQNMGVQQTMIPVTQTGMPSPPPGIHLPQPTMQAQQQFGSQQQPFGLNQQQPFGQSQQQPFGPSSQQPFGQSQHQPFGMQPQQSFGAPVQQPIPGQNQSPVMSQLQSPIHPAMQMSQPQAYLQPVQMSTQSTQPMVQSDVSVLMLQMLQNQQKKEDTNTKLLLIGPAEKFDGTEPEKFKAWAEVLKQRLTVAEADKDTSLAHIRNSLSGSALRVFESAQPHVKNSVKETWTFLEARFQSKYADSMAQQKFNTLQYETGQDINQFFSELESVAPIRREDPGFEDIMFLRLQVALQHTPLIGTVAKHSAKLPRKPGALFKLLDVIATDQFGKKIEANLKGVTEKTETEKEAKSNGQKQQQSNNTSNKPNQQGRTRWCTYCDSSTHFTDKCRYVIAFKESKTASQHQPMQNSGAAARGQQSYNNSQQSNQQQRGVMSMKCYTCGEFGHKADRCPKRNQSQSQSGSQALNWRQTNADNRPRPPQNRSAVHAVADETQSDTTHQDQNDNNQQPSNDANGNGVFMVTELTSEEVNEHMSAALTEHVWQVTSQGMGQDEKESSTPLSTLDYDINGVVVHVKERLLDTGSKVNLISPAFVDQLQAKHDELQLAPCPCKLVSFSGDIISCKGSVNLTVTRYDGHTVQDKFHMSDHVGIYGHKVLLGEPLMDQIDIKLRDKEGNVHPAQAMADRVNHILSKPVSPKANESDSEQDNSHKQTKNRVNKVFEDNFDFLKDKLQLQDDDEEVIVMYSTEPDAVAMQHVAHISLHSSPETAKQGVDEVRLYQKGCPVTDMQQSNFDTGETQAVKLKSAVQTVSLVEQISETEVKFAPDPELEDPFPTDSGFELADCVQTNSRTDINDPQIVEDKFRAGLKFAQNDNITVDMKHQFTELLLSKKDAFSSAFIVGKTQNVQELGRSDFQHVIDTGNAEPIKTSIRRTPPAYREETRKMITDLLLTNCIEPSASEWRSAMVFVKKKDGSLRLCIDYRALNNVTKTDTYPLPLIDDLLDRMQGWTVCSSVDIKSGYHHLRMNEQDKQKTAFYALDRLYHWLVMPMGLKNAPAAFVRALNEVLGDLTDVCCVVYIDDILIYSKSYEEHKVHMALVLDRLIEFGFRLNLNKCLFLAEKCEYLGMIVSPEGISPDPKKITALTNYPLPVDKQELWRWIGMAVYVLRFFPHLCITLAPFQDILKQLPNHTSKIQWTEELKKMFEQAKRILAHPVSVSRPVPGQGYNIACDECCVGFGSVLTQVQDGQEKPISFASRRTTSNESKLDATSLEALAVLFAVKKYHPYIVNEQVTVYTDHKPLLGLFTKPQSQPKFERWSLALQQYNINLQYRAGADNTAADALSRAPVSEQKTVAVIQVDSAEHKQNIIDELHSGTSGTHGNADQLYYTVKYWYDTTQWPTLKADCKQKVAECNICKQRSNRYEVLPLESRPPPSQPRQRWHIDFTVIRPQAAKPYLCLAIDAFSRWCVGLPASKQNGKVAISLIDEIVRQFGVMDEVVTDCGSQFTGKLFQDHLKELGVKQHLTTPYMKTGNSLAERANQTIQQVLAKMLNGENKALNSWYLHAKDAIARYNKQYHSTLKCSPFKSMFGVECSLNPEQFEEHPILGPFWSDLRNNMVKRQQQSANYFKATVQNTTFKPGDLVYVKDTTNMQGRARKIDSPNTLEAEVIAINSEHRNAICKMSSGKTRQVAIEFLQHRF